jgi:hypothetical protein
VKCGAPTGKAPPINFTWTTNKYVIEATVDPETLKVTRLGGWGDFSTDAALARMAEARARVQILKLEAAVSQRSEKNRESAKVRGAQIAARYGEARDRFNAKVANFRRRRGRWPRTGEATGMLVTIAADGCSTPVDESIAWRWMVRAGKPKKKVLRKRRSRKESPPT